MAADIVVNFKAADGQFAAGLARVLALLQNSVGQMKTLTGGLASATGAAAVQAEKQVFLYHVAALAQQQRAARDDWSKRRALMQQELDYIGVMRGQQSAQYSNMLRQIERAEQQHEQQQRQATARTIDAQQQAAQAGIDIANEQTNFERQLGLINGVEAVQRTQQTELQKYQIERQALEEKWALWDQDPVKRAEIDRQLEKLEAQHGLAVQKLQDQEVLESKKRWESVIQPVTSAFSTSINGIIQGTQTLRQAMANLAQSILLSFVDMGVKLAADWLLVHLGLQATAAATETEQTATHAAGVASRQAMDTTATTTSIIQAKLGAVSIIPTYAAEAATAAMASVAAIPFVGWAMAPGVGAEQLALSMSYMGVASAEGGYDIPAGVNPMTQLHQNEMVLPAPLADRVRTMTAGGGAGAVHLHVHAVDAKSVERLFRDHGPALAKVLRGQHRNFSGALA